VIDDLNAQYPGWGSTRSNFAGVSLNEYLMQSPFVVLNDRCGTKISTMLIMLVVLITLVKSNFYIYFHGAQGMIF